MGRTASVVVGLLVVALTGSVAAAGEIGFEEDFALAKDRTVPLKQLIVGTEEYYYYHCLHLQHTGRFDQVEILLLAWIDRHKHTSRVKEIRNRQALLMYKTNPAKALAYLRTQLGLRFDHKRELLDKKTSLPTELNPTLISREALTRRAIARHKNLRGFEDTAFEWLNANRLSMLQLRDMLQRLRRPDFPNLPALVVKELSDKRYSRGFGSMTIHRQMLTEQLDACLKLKPDLLNQSNFVNIYMSKLAPGPDEDWQHDAKVREAYLERLWAFVRRLAPVHNSLKANVLYKRLVHDRALGVYDKARFMQYLKLPRRAHYVEPRYLKQFQVHRVPPANLNADYSKYCRLRPIRNDEQVVRSYLMHFFGKEKSYKAYTDYVRDTYLKHLFAETMITGGMGDMERWYSMLPPASYKALQERTDLDFAYTNQQVFDVGDAVKLDLFVKNVKTLIVKVYEINALNYYRDNGRDVNTDVNLDGLVANQQKTHAYTEPKLRRVKRTFTFPTLKDRGVYVIEFIGNGKSSRALVRKGRLRFITRTSTAGYVFTVLDEKNKKLPNAALWLAGHRYTAEKDGTITVPFSNNPGRQPIILQHGEFASLDQFDHGSANYSLAAGIHVDREALLTRNKATVAVRPALYLNGTPVTLSVLEDVALTITSVDADGVSTTKKVAPFKLVENAESTFEFQVPERLARIGFVLTGKVEVPSLGKKVDLVARSSFSVNQIDKTHKVEDLFLSHAGGAYTVHVLGKSGEPKADRPVKLVFKHRDFTDPVHVTLQTDAAGRVELGPLTDIATVSATGPEGTSHAWPMVKDRHSYPSAIHGAVGGTIQAPYMGKAKKPVRSEMSLLEVRGGTFTQDRFGSLSIKNGFIRITDLPAGDYSLLLKESGTQISVRVTAGKELAGNVVAKNRFLEQKNPTPLQIVEVSADKKNVRIQLANATKFARVHVVATRYMPSFSLYKDLGAIGFAEPGSMAWPVAPSVYVSGRNIGDEYRYIIERQLARHFAGNMLTRPMLLLNPWAVRDTQTGVDQAKAGDQWGRARKPDESRARHGRAKRPPAGGGSDFADMDFLPHPSAVLLNLRPDKNGMVTVDRRVLAGGHQLHVLAADPLNTVYREHALAEVKMDNQDLRLLANLDPTRHFAERKQITVVGKGGQLVLDDIKTARFQTYDTLAKVYRLYATLSGNATLGEFRFILDWPKMKAEEKQKKYSKYACHELSFFLLKKDPAFFETEILPYLKNKKDKTFLDYWLLDDRRALAGFTKPWAFAQLNTVERVLLARKIAGERPRTARHVTDLYDLIPPNIERFNRLFATALKGQALEAADEYGFAEAAGKVKQESAQQLREKLDLGAARRAGRGRPPAPAAAPRRRDMQRDELKKLAAERRKEMQKGQAAGEAEGLMGKSAFFEDDKSRRSRARQFYRKLDKTKEWAENNYYHLTIDKQNAALVGVNGFWKDFAQHDVGTPFVSPALAEAAGNFTEMMFALSVLDLPFEAAKHKPTFDKARFTLAAGSPMVVFHREVKPTVKADDAPPILVSQNFFRHGDRYRHVGNERFDKFVTEEFLVHVVYGCQVVVTNPTSSRQKLDVLVQIPQGAMPVAGGRETRSHHIVLDPYRTKTFDFYFYFPKANQFAHYPVQVAKNEKLIVSAAPFTFNVVEKLSKIDTGSWDYISQHGTPDQVLSFLQERNINRIQLARIAFRMKDKAFFTKVIALLAQRHVYDQTLWSYGILHNAPAAIRQYLQHNDGFVNQCGAYIDTPLLTIDPVVRKAYEHLEYSPLVNARAHRLGKARKILNDRFYQQYERFMRVLRYRPRMDDTDRMTAVYYLLLQDRIEDAQRFFKQVNPKRLTTRLQYDYFAAYLDFFNEKPAKARRIAAKYAEHPVPRWRKLFANVIAQLDEIQGKTAGVVDTEDRDQQQAKLAATEPSFEFTVEGKKVTVDYQNLTQVRVNYYLMDIELLFSRNPFVQKFSGQFAYIRPNHAETVKLPAKKRQHVFALPKQFHNSNVRVELTAAGIKKAQAVFSNALSLQVIENYGQVRVTHRETGKPLPRVYVKVYAKRKDGRTVFFKDGYTDLRGRFDYTSLSTNELDIVERFALLVLSEQHGAVVREAAPPKR